MKSLWSVEASLHIYKQLYLWNLWIEYDVLGCLVVFPFQKFSKKVFTLHAHIIFRWLTTCYQREEFAQLFTSLHASSHLVTLWFRLSQTKKSILSREGLWRLVKTCEDLRQVFTMINHCTTMRWTIIVKSEDFFAIFYVSWAYNS